jgi:hypothetical protein
MEAARRSTRQVADTRSGSMKRRWLGTGIIIALLLAAVAAVVASPPRFLGDPTFSEGSHGDDPAGGPGPVLEGQPRPPPPAPYPPGQGTGQSPPVDVLMRILESAPPGVAGEWALAGIGSASPVPGWLTSVLSRIVQTTAVPTPPFQVQYVLGNSDREWLESLASEVERELVVRRRKTASPETDTSAWDGLSAEMNAYLADIAARRVAAQPELKARFEDRRSLRDLEEGSLEASWLSTMIEEVSSPHLWSAEDLLTIADRSLVAADDLVFLREASIEIGGIWGLVTRAEDRLRATQTTRAVVLRVYDRLARRRR